MVRLLRTSADLREALRGFGFAPGLVPTMGALHDGHAALIRRSVAENPATVVSLFVNPAQFADVDDLTHYPRTPERDLELAAGAGADLVFAPAAHEIYPPGFATGIEVAGLTDRWEGAIRPGHFRGVATVVTILINLVRPGRTYFGEKDFQQLVVVRRLHRDLALPGEIVGCPTVRDTDGLALSSRNARLTPEERRQAGVVPLALDRMAEMVANGEWDVKRLVAEGTAVLTAAPDLIIDYLAVVDSETLEPLTEALRELGSVRALVAVRLGAVRLIDNRVLGAENADNGAASLT